MSKKQYQDKDWLYEKHVEQGLTNVEIAELCGVSDATICRWKKKHDIPSNGYDTPQRVRDKISESVSQHLEENGHPFEGETHSDESKQKMGEAKMGENNPHFGKKRPDFADTMKGENNPSWKGGITEKMDFRKSNKWKRFSHSMKELLGWECGSCGKHGSESRIHLHHATPVSNGGGEYDNTFIALCEDCHYDDYEQWHTTDEMTQLRETGGVMVAEL